MKLTDLVNITLTEMPVQDISLIGNWDRSHGFRDPMDRRAITSPKLMDKVRQKLAGSEHDFVFYFINSPGARKMAFHGRIGSDDDLAKMVGPKVAKQIEADRASGKLDNAITILYVDNASTDRMKMTPWIIIHRMWHAFDPKVGTFGFAAKMAREIQNMLFRSARDILSNLYGIDVDSRQGRFSYEFYRPGEPGYWALRRFFEVIGTTRACRDKALSFPTEILPEIFTQYLTTGAIQFNPLPDNIRAGRFWAQIMRGKEEDRIDWDEHLQMVARDIGSEIDSFLSSLAGEMFAV